MKPLITTLLLLLPLAGFANAAPPPPKGFITLTPEKNDFLATATNTPFKPWGFNYDRDYRMRLLEDYWDKEWSTIEQDFKEMKDLGANVIRIHLQFSKFMDAPDKPNASNLKQLDRLVKLAEQTGLTLDLTGLACYRKADVPAWYDALPEQERWDAQAHFWEAIAKTCADRPGVFCYNLINEPLVPGDKQPDQQWLHPNALAGFHYVQFIALDPAGRERTAIAQQWTRKMVAAIRKHDPHHLVTIGMFPMIGSGFDPKILSPDLDFIAVHIYPETKKLDEAMKTIETFHVPDRPLVIEEIFPMNIQPTDLARFLPTTFGSVDGCISFYWGKSMDELKQSNEIPDHLIRAWLEEFTRINPNPR